MKAKIKFILIGVVMLLVVGMVFAFYFISKSANAECSVPASCCHSQLCVPTGLEPNCSGVFCSMQCEPNTLDCGGSCACQKGKCAAIYGG